MALSRLWGSGKGWKQWDTDWQVGPMKGLAVAGMGLSLKHDPRCNGRPGQAKSCRWDSTRHKGDTKGNTASND